MTPASPPRTPWKQRLVFQAVGLALYLVLSTVLVLVTDLSLLNCYLIAAATTLITMITIDRTRRPRR